MEGEPASRTRSKHDRCGFILLFKFLRVSGPDLEDRTAVFDSFARPPLVIHGTEDGFIPSRTRRGPTAAPGCPRFLKGAGLTPMWDRSEATSEAIIAWTQGLRACATRVGVAIPPNPLRIARSFDSLS